MGCVVELTPKEAVIQTPDVSDDETGTTGDSDPAETLPDPDAIVTLNCPVPTPCRDQGICAGVQAPVCQEDGTWQCFHDAVDGFENTELTCDGQDNDCDGTTDEDILIGTWPDCGGETGGVCGDGAPARCIDAEMVCDYSTITDYEADETLCDGKDNDCDGTTDEVTGTAISACSLKGVCALIPEIECVGGQWSIYNVGHFAHATSKQLCFFQNRKADFLVSIATHGIAN